MNTPQNIKNIYSMKKGNFHEENSKILSESSSIISAKNE